MDSACGISPHIQIVIVLKEKKDINFAGFTAIITINDNNGNSGATLKAPHT